MFVLILSCWRGLRWYGSYDMVTKYQKIKCQQPGNHVTYLCVMKKVVVNGLNFKIFGASKKPPYWHAALFSRSNYESCITNILFWILAGIATSNLKFLDFWIIFSWFNKFTGAKKKSKKSQSRRTEPWDFSIITLSAYNKC